MALMQNWSLRHRALFLGVVPALLMLMLLLGYLLQARLTDAERELAGKGPWRMNQLIHEIITSPGGRADTLAPAYPPFDFTPGRAGVSLASPTHAQVRVRRDPFGVSLVSTTSMPAFPSMVQEVRLTNGRKHVDFSTRCVKEELDATEAAYIAFPFALKPARVHCDISGGVFTPGSEQISGTATDWYDLQHGVQLADEDLTLTWLCAEAPLVEFGEMKTGKTPSPPILDNGLIFSYVLNNHWMTNFFARQSGEIVARFRLLSERSSSTATLGNAGRELLTPLLPVRLGARSARDPGLEFVAGTDARLSAGYAEMIEGNAVLEVVKQARDGDGLIFRVHDIGGVAGTTRLGLRWPVPVTALPCTILEEPLIGASTSGPDRDLVLSAGLAPFGTATWRLHAVK